MSIASRAEQFSSEIREMTEEEFFAHRDAVMNEGERRQRLANAPSQIGAISAAFIADGGDISEILDALPQGV